MAKKTSAGILAYRGNSRTLEVFLVHPGGPYWRNRDRGAWSIPKGEVEDGEDLLQTAIREFREETGLLPGGDYIELEPQRQSGGKLVHAWAAHAEIDPSRIKSNDFVIEWPPGSGVQQRFPEVDRAEWFPVSEALEKVLSGQRGLIEQLREQLREQLQHKVGAEPTSRKS